MLPPGLGDQLTAVLHAPAMIQVKPQSLARKRLNEG
jgi:hypothetical protein